MPEIEVDEPYARPPRVPTIRSGPAWNGDLDPDRGLAELSGVEIEDRAVDPTGCDELSIEGCVVRRVGLEVGDGPQVEIRTSRFDGCDFSQARVMVLQRSHLDGCKLTGTDLSGAAITDVEFERCSLRYTNLRMARLARVRFVDCTFDDVDAFQIEAEDVSFDRCRLAGVNVDRLSATRVDLRGVAELGLIGVGRLDGCLVADHQLPALAPMLALAVGLDLER